MEFVYRLVHMGWAEARISDGTQSTTPTASYLRDALGDLLEAVGVLLEGAKTARCSWEEEPGEYRWVYNRRGADIELCIIFFRDLWSFEPDEKGTVVFETRRPQGDGQCDRRRRRGRP